MPARSETADATRTEFDAAWDEFFAAVRRARGRSLQEMEQEGLSLAQFQLLSSFMDDDSATEMSVGALATAAGVAQPTATRMLGGLERAGVVVRRPAGDDRRRVVVELTDAGRSLLGRKRKLVAAKQDAVFSRLEPADRKRAATLLRAMAAGIEEST